MAGGTVHVNEHSVNVLFAMLKLQYRINIFQQIMRQTIKSTNETKT